jgi:hypothetical protein
MPCRPAAAHRTPEATRPRPGRAKLARRDAPSGECRPGLGRNLGDDLAIWPLRHHRRPTMTNALNREYSQTPMCRGRSNLADTEEVTGSIPVSPTNVCAGQRLVTGSWVTSLSRCAPYGGSKLGAEDHHSPSDTVVINLVRAVTGCSVARCLCRRVSGERVGLLGLSAPTG